MECGAAGRIKTFFKREAVQFVLLPLFVVQEYATDPWFLHESERGNQNMVINHKLKMDLTQQAQVPKVDMVQNDQYTRKLEISMYANGETWTIPEDVHGVVCYTRADGSRGEYDALPGGVSACSYAGNVLTVTVAPAALTVPGPVMLAVDLLSGVSKVSTFTVMIYVKRSVAVSENGVEDYYQVNAFLPMPEAAQVGKFLKVAAVDEYGAVTALEMASTGTQTVVEGNAVPDYWQDAVDAAAEKVTANQDAGGKNCITFAWFSDSHVNQDSDIPNPGYTGTLAAAVMDACHIPYAVMCGDAARSDGNGLTNESQMRKSLMAADQIFAPIGYERLLQVQGNHDGSWGYDSSLTDPYFCYQMDAKALYNAIFRKVLDNTNCIFGGDGSYYYIDHPASKVRFIILNSLWVEDGEDTDGNALHRRMRTYGYGNEQLNWLANTALSFSESGWAVVLAAHVPPIASYDSTMRDEAVIRGILTAFAEGSAYSGKYGTSGNWDYVSVSCDFSSRILAEIVGFFCGHVHADNIITDELPFPVITITSDADLSYDESEETRVYGTDNEHAIDFVTINRDTSTVNLVRLGVGADRIFTYGGGETKIYYSITHNVTNCTLDNSAKSIEKNGVYGAIVVVADGCTLDTVTVTMGGVDVTADVYSDGMIGIVSVTGDLVITAKAVKQVTCTNLADTTSADWANDSRLNSSAAVVECEGSCVSNWIECEIGDVLRIYGLNILDSTSGYICYYRTDTEVVEPAKCTSYTEEFTEENGVISYTIFTIIGSISEYWGGKVRLSGALTVDSPEDVIISINEEI